MDLRQLAAFVKVAELGSFTKAAEFLGTGQPVLSRQIRLLEVELGRPLLARNGRGASLTEPGRRLLEHARGILHQVERAREDLAGGVASMSGRVAVGVPPSLARLLTVPLSRAFAHAVPRGKLAITEGLSAGLIAAVGEGRLDLALVYESKFSPEVELEPLCEEALSVVGPEGADLGPQVSLQKLADLALVIPSRPNAIRIKVETALARLDRRPLIAIEVDGVSAILDLVETGAGYGVLPPYAIEADARGRALQAFSIAAPGLKIPISIATSARRAVTETQRVALDLLREVAREFLRF
jgi:LysR family nitrogen assimilation transcriptional regulator